jgi:hypothetical protein
LTSSAASGKYTPDGALHYHVSVGPSGSVTIGPSQASFVPVRGKYRDEILDGGWPSVWEHFVGQIGQEMADGRYPADLTEITWRVAPRGGIHLDIIVPMTDDARDGLPWVQPVYGLFDGAVRELQRRVRQRDR